MVSENPFHASCALNSGCRLLGLVFSRAFTASPSEQPLIKTPLRMTQEDSEGLVVFRVFFANFQGFVA
mgnify:CR=1